MATNILLIGSGGREHALAWKLAQSANIGKFYCAPGNAGISEICECVSIAVENHAAIISFCQEYGVDLVVIGPEAPLVAGLVDDLERAEILAFGPTQAAAQLEGSKSFTHEICDQFNIPAANYERFNNVTKAKAYIRQQVMPIVVKADGLAAGKGVVIANDIAAAYEAVEACFEGEFGAAGQCVVIEEFLDGEEISLFAICDGQVASLMGTAQDHKRAYDDDLGPNTGGMGAYSPATIVGQDLIDEIMGDIIVPTLAGLHARGAPFKGVLFAGLMLCKDGPKLIEYNVRFGDPECQVLMMRLKSDLLELMLSAASGSLLDHEIEWDERAALCVVMATKGYPAAYQNGSAIELGQSTSDNVKIFHAGTQYSGDALTAIGGRVLGVTAIAENVKSAQKTAYHRIAKIDWPQGFWRTDIGWREIEREDE